MRIGEALALWLEDFEIDARRVNSIYLCLPLSDMILQYRGIVIDTPGMRELGVDCADLSRAFADIDQLVEQCKFRDCTHQ
ncbi:MAG: hypothetical protein APF81_08765 [Desulfosporosinus sp. BRH_c37]|nr:MAG: hypothetical protein APF81_08765 [Desulfosporosinus sp. BRH_c37]